jgi:hypothetical protein
MKTRYTKNDYFKIASALSLWSDNGKIGAEKAALITGCFSDISVLLQIKDYQAEPLLNPSSCRDEPNFYYEVGYLAAQIACEKAGL